MTADAGHALHEKVPPSRWCVTYEDLREFRKEVQAAVAQGQITPTERDPFDTEDDIIGPCVHSVCQQFIMPVTAAAGGMSWALMKHEDGLPCDVFVTHCWQEGIYEFIDQVLHSWPRNATGAYCCMLSNPQNGDIGSLISDVRQSPFAVALESATFMLVVPNRACSIYSRIWCAYEAFLAVSWSKVISTASAPIKGLWRNSLYMLVWYFVLSGSVVMALRFISAGVCFSDQDQVGSTPCVMGMPRLVHIFVFLVVPLLVASFYLPTRFMAPSTTTRVLTLLGISAICVPSGNNVLSLIYEGANSLNVCGLLGYLGSAVALSATEADRLWNIQAEQQREQLMNQYTGNLADARASIPNDKEQILAELENSGELENANFSVSVLLKAGRWTPGLRRAFALAGRLEKAAYWNVSNATIGCTLWVSISGFFMGAIVTEYNQDRLLYKTCSHDVQCGHPLSSWVMWCFVLDLSLAVAWVIFFCKADGEERRFMARIMTFSHLVFLLPCFVFEFVVSGQQYVWLAPVALCKGVVVLALSALGLAGTVAVPVVGPSLVRRIMFVARGSTMAPEVTMPKGPTEEASFADSQLVQSSSKCIVSL